LSVQIVGLLLAFGKLGAQGRVVIFQLIADRSQVNDLVLHVVMCTLYTIEVGTRTVKVATQDVDVLGGCCGRGAKGIYFDLQCSAASPCSVKISLQGATDSSITLLFGVRDGGHACHDIGGEVLEPFITGIASDRFMDDDLHAVVELPWLENILLNNLCVFAIEFFASSAHASAGIQAGSGLHVGVRAQGRHRSTTPGGGYR
jgi:hypothetical protein